ncbi:CDP-glycerol glycerophosphotransferase family protein [Maribacter sp. LLG6340-A2]|uniref:CDP-glycerol glycerophosphotransferase family protein n=1 Tax=Maribacter sp. LLG6340-A2 TaxID=3160834 RepID=UPI003868DB2C
MNLNKERVDIFNSYYIGFDGINIIAMSQVFVFELSQKRLNSSFLDLVKKLSMENYLKYFLSFFSKNNNKKSKYLFINDIHNASMIFNMRSIQEKFDVPFKEIISDKRLISEESKFIYKYQSLFKFFGGLPRYLKILRDNRETIVALSKEFKVSSSLLYLNLLDSFFILCAVKELFDSEKDIEKIVLNSDVHKVSRAIVLLAKKIPIKTLVIQHGSTVLEYGYLPVNCDYMITWGELSNKWFLDRNTPLEKLKTLGTPKMDFIQNFVINKRPIVEEVQNALIIVNPIGDENVNTFLRIILDSGIHEKFNLTIKLHPSSFDNRDLVEKYFSKTNAKILKKQNTQKLIYETNVVITTTSTVGNEAIAFYKPLIQIKLDNIDTIMDYEDYNCCHQIQDANDLCKLLKNKELLISKIKNYEVFIAKYFYRLDGKSAERIKDFIQG